MRNVWLLLLIFVSLEGMSQNGNFRSIATGSWHNLSTWEQDPNNNGTWVAATNIPGSSDGSISIRNGHSVTVDAVATADELTVETGGTLIISGSLSIDNGTGMDLVNMGTVNSAGVTQLSFATNSRYNHARNGGTIPLATWGTNSTCYVSGVTTTSPTNLNPSLGFANFTWNCESQAANVNFGGNLRNIAEDLFVLSTNGFLLQMASIIAPVPINIGGNLNVLNTSRFAFATAASMTVNIGGDFNFASSHASGSPLKNGGTVTLNIEGDFLVSNSGLLNMSIGANNMIVNLEGDFNASSGTITETSSGAGIFNFVGPQPQSVISTAAITNDIRYDIAAGADVTAVGESGITGELLTVNGILRLESTNSTGAIVLGKVAGNIRTTSRTYNAGSRLIYQGGSAQFIGQGHPSVSTVDTEINNPSGVTFSATNTGNVSATQLALGGTLILTSGVLEIASNTTARQLTINGNITSAGGTISTSGTFVNLVINGTGNLATFPLAPSVTIRNLTMNRTAGGSATFANTLSVLGTTTLTAGTLRFTGTSSLSGTVTQSAGTTLDMSSGSLTLQGNYVNNGGVLVSNASSSLSISGTTALTSPLTFDTGNSLGSLILNKTNAGISVVINSPVTITSQLTLSDGQLDIVGGALSLATTATLSRTPLASVSGSSPSGGPYHLAYAGGNLTTGLEIPASGILRSLTINTNNNSTVTLSQSITLQEGFVNTVPGSRLSCNANSLTAATFSNAGIFNAPNSSASPGLSLSGNFNNDGVFNHSNGTVVFTGPAGSLSGTAISTTVFQNLTIQTGATLTANAGTLSLNGNFTDNGSFNHGSGTVAFLGAAGAKAITGSSNTQFWNVQLNKVNAGISTTVFSAKTILNNLSVLDGQFRILSNLLTMGGNASITRADQGSIVTSSPAGGPWHLEYIGASMSPGLEIPATGIIRSLTVNTNTGTAITLSSNLTVTEDVTVSSVTNPTLTCGTFSLSCRNLVNGGTFNAPSSTLTLTGDLINTGTFNLNTCPVFFAGNSSISSTSSIIFNDITLTGILNGPTELELVGDLTNNGGTFLPGSGTVRFSGTEVQTVGGNSSTSFFNIVVDNVTLPSAVSIEGTALLTGVLTLGSNMRLDADGSTDTGVLTIESTSLRDGSIGPLSGSAAVLGNVTVRRFLPAADNTHRFISSPTQNTPVSQLQDDFAVTGTFTNTSFPCDGCTDNGASLRYYAEHVLGPLDQGYVPTPVTNSSNAETLVVGRGYASYMWNGGSDIVMDVRGAINAGSVNYTVTHTVSSPVQPYADGWNLLGNPFPSGIVWDNSAGWARSANIDPVMWMYDVTQNQWRSYDYLNPMAGDVENGIISSGQAFWVYVHPGAATLSVNEQAKSGVDGSYYRRKVTQPALTMILTHNQKTDRAMIVLEEQATADYDMGLDRYKLATGVEFGSVAFMNPASKRPMYSLAVDQLHEEEIQIDFIAAEKGQYELSLTSSTDRLNDYFLFDRVLNIATPLNSSYSFSSEKGKFERFVLTKKSYAANEFDRVITVYPNPAQSEFVIQSKLKQGAACSLVDGQGRLIASFELAEGVLSTPVNVSSLKPGLYYLKVMQPNGQSLNTKILKK